MTLSEPTQYSPSGASPLADHDRFLTTLSELASAPGPNGVDAWPGLTVDRRCAPGRLRYEFDSLSVGFVAQANGATTHVCGRRIDSQPAYLITGAGSNVDVKITASSVRHPVLYCSLRIDPHLTRSISSSMYPLSVARERQDLNDAPSVSALDGQLMVAAVGFLTSLSTGCDRRVLAPLRMNELVYRLLQRQQRLRLVRLATEELRRNPIAAALGHISDHLTEPLSVESLATRVNMSPSAFSRAFRDATGRPPYQYIKDRRLDLAKDLLADPGLGVSAVAGAVGYRSVSHFIKEFCRRYGSTPGDYAGSGMQRHRSVQPPIQ